MKKTLAIILALALVFSSFTFAFAEETLPADAQGCKGLGMLVGAGQGVTLDYLKTAPTRIQSAIMVLRLKGLEADAKAFVGTANFADAADAQWAAPIMAYLKAHPEVGFVGTGGVNFEPNKQTDAKSYYKVMLETLGYKQNSATVIGDFTFEGTFEFAAKNGLTKISSVLSFTVNDLATATIEALKANIKGSTKTLAASLVEAKIITEAAAVAAGVYTTVPSVLAVESVKAINLKETVVTFNKEVDEDSAEDTDNYLLDEDAINADITLNADKKSVTITWDVASELDNQTEYDLTVESVLDVAGAELAEVTVTFLANDVTTPVAESLTLVGPNKLKIVFSEPIEIEGTIEIADKDFDYEVADITIDGNEAIIELSDDELEVGSYTVEVTDFKDFAGLKNLKKVFTLAYAKDTTAPVATIKEATQTKVVVEFNKPVYNGEAGNAQQLNESYFYHTYTSYEPVLVVASDDSEEFTVYFTNDAAIAGEGYTAAEALALRNLDLVDRPLPEGSVKFVVVADAAGTGNDNITDEWGNELENNVNFNLTISSDVTAPVVSDIDVVDQNTVDVYFSEDVDITGNDASDYFTLVDEDGEDVDIDGLSYSNADDEYIATLSFDAGNTLEGEYSLTIEDVVDLALEENEIAKVTKKFAVGDETAPSLASGDVTVLGVNSVDADGHDYIYVTFEEDMATSGTYSVLDKDNYQIKVGNAYHDLDTDDKIATFNGNDKIKITLDDPAIYNVADSSIELVIGRVADALNNKVDTFNLAYVVKSETSPVITAVVTKGEKEIEITIDGELKAVNKSYISVSDGVATADLYSIKSWKIDDGDTIITGILPSALALNSSADTNITVTLDNNAFETISGTDVATCTFAAANVDDGYAPSVDEVVDEYIMKTPATGDNGIFTITFDENLNTTATVASLYAQDLVVKNSDGDILVAGVDYTTSAAGMVVTVQIANISDSATIKGNYKVFSNATIKYIQDLEGNKANAFTDSVTLYDLVVK